MSDFTVGVLVTFGVVVVFGGQYLMYYIFEEKGSEPFHAGDFLGNLARACLGIILLCFLIVWAVVPLFLCSMFWDGWNTNPIVFFVLAVFCVWFYRYIFMLPVEFFKKWN